MTFMTEHRAPTPARWPFLLVDIALVAVAFGIVNHYPFPIPVAALALAVGCIVVAALVAVAPFRMHYQALIRFAESNELNDVVSQINRTEETAEVIRTATAQWQGVQEQSARTVATAREIAERMEAEAKAFEEFMQRANEQEKATLRLEVDKLRRSEGQWLQVLVHVLDHVYALHQAGARSGQPNLEAQLGRFREACYEAVRRIGLMPIQAASGEVYDGGKHQVVEGAPEPETGALIGQALASGYSFQGQLVRRTLVVIQGAPVEQPSRVPESEVVDPAPTGSEGEGNLPAEPSPQPAEESTFPADSSTDGPAADDSPAEPFRLES